MAAFLPPFVFFVGLLFFADVLVFVAFREVLFLDGFGCARFKTPLVNGVVNGIATIFLPCFGPRLNVVTQVVSIGMNAQTNGQ